MEQKVKIESLVNGLVSINNSDLRIQRTWERKGAVKSIDLDVLEELIYDPGVEYMFRQGILAINDMDVKKKLGLEPEDAEEPVNIIIFDDNKMDRLMTRMPFYEFKQEVDRAPLEQVRNLVEYAIEHEYTDYEKCKYLQEKVQTNILAVIENNRKAKEEVGPIE